MAYYCAALTPLRRMFLPFTHWHFSLRFEHLNECLLWNVHFADAFHPFLPFLLFLQQFAFSGNVAAVAFRSYIFSQRRNRFPGDNFSADGRLDGHLIELTRNHFLELSCQLASTRFRPVLVHNGRK